MITGEWRRLHTRGFMSVLLNKYYPGD